MGILNLALWGIEWERPWALWLLPLCLWAWWVLSRSPLAESRFTGSIHLWRQVRPEGNKKIRSGGMPRRFSEWLALLLLIVALGGPRTSEPQGQKTWAVVVDQSPSMSLPFAPRRPSRGGRHDTLGAG